MNIHQVNSDKSISVTLTTVPPATVVGDTMLVPALTMGFTSTTTGTSTVKIQVSPDGNTWVDFGSTIVDGIAVVKTMPFKYFRIWMQEIVGNGTGTVEISW